MNRTAIDIAVVGAGPVGLALALQAARTLPNARIAVFDARAADADPAADARVLALSLGSVQWLRRLVPWPASAAPILEVHVSQQPPSAGRAAVRIKAFDEGVPLLGAVLPYGALLAPLQRAWAEAVAAEPQRLRSHWGTRVAAVKPVAGGVEIDAGIAERHDLAVVAEGGVYGQQPQRPVVRDYRQTAWVGRVRLEGAPPGVAFERFTRQGPAALLPLATGEAALVWCVAADDDPVRPLADAQRLALLQRLFPAEAGRIVEVSPLKDFALGLNAERSLVDGRRLRIGNAAQTLHPVAGQGLNLGLRDAHALVAALRRHDDVDAALRSVEWARGVDRWATIATTDVLARGFTWTLPGAGLARGAGLALVEALPPVKHWLARRMMFGWR